MKEIIRDSGTTSDPETRRRIKHSVSRADKMSSTVNDRRVPPERPATPTELTNIRLAVELSKQTYAEEEERRKSVMSGVQPLQRSTSSDPMCSPAKMPPVIDDLIDWTDPAQKEHEEKVAFIKRLYEMDSLSPSNLSPAVAEASATVYGPPTRGISVPCFPSFPAFALSPPAVVPRSATAFPIATTPAPVGPPPALSLNYQRKTPQQQGADVRWRSSSLAATPTGGMGSNYPLMVPFRPTSIRLGNGDLIDLGPPAETPGEPATWDNLKYEFDPLYSSPRSAEVVQIRQEYQKADESAFLNKRPPVKPPRLSLAERERSASALQVSSTSLSAALRQVELYTLDDVYLIDVTSDLALQLALLQSRLRPPTEWGASLFISPTVDYALPGASSVMLVVHKDHSWPTSSERDSLSFTCAVSSTVEQILESVLTTFFPNENDLPTVDYGLKVFGLDEYLAPHSVIGHYAFLRQALAFGDDIRLQVGRLPRPSTMRKSTTSDLDHSRLIAAIDKRGVIAGVEKSSIQLILETLRGELKRALGDSASHGRNGVKQSVKALCQLFNRVQPHDLVQALRSFESAATNDDLRREASRVVTKVHRLLTMYSASTAVEFATTPLKKKSGESEGEERARERREIVSMDEKLVVCIESVHNLPEEWKLTYETFTVAAHVMHGAAELCRGWRDPPRKLIADPHLFPYLNLNSWVPFELPLCIAPREARVCFVMYGLLAPIASPSSSNVVSAPIEKQLAWTSVPLFEHDGLLRQNSLLLPFTVSDDTVVQPWGPRPLLTPKCSDPICMITFPSFSYDVFFPDIVLNDNRLSRDFSSLDVETQQYLEDVIEGGVTHSLTPDEKEVLWEKRHYLRSFPEALPLVLASAVGWDWAGLNNIYTLIDDWSPLTPVQAIELLLPHFPDMMVRERAMRWIKAASTDFLFNFLPQLVEALRFETFEHSSLAVLLLDLSANDSRFAFEVYWQLQQRIDHCSQVPYSIRCILLQNELLEVRGDQFRLEVERQHRLLANLDAAAAQVKMSSDGSRLAILQQHLSTLDGDLLATNVRLPLNPSFSAVGVHVDRCNYFNSLTLPLKLAFRGISIECGVLHKVGDDMRQDSLVLQMIRMMNDIWLSAELDLRMVIFRCLPTGLKKGMVELIKDCRTLREIQGATGVFKDEVLKKWLQTQNPSEFEYKVALKNFQLSCAGWCVGTYVLGIGDRHNDNILITTKGHVFHIDFGKYLGDWQMAGGFRRDRVPFIFTADMAYVINEGSSQPTEQYQTFVDNCCRAFNLLRKRYSLVVNLMKMMSCSDVPGMTMDAVNFVQDNLMLNLSETEATVQFTRLIEESLMSKFPRWNFLAHTLVQLKNSPFSKFAGDDHPDKLSFVPHLYSEDMDGRIESVHLVRCEKWHTPEKVYMYKVAVRRRGETVASYVYRSYAEFHEFYLKLYRRFPFTPLTPLSKGTNIGRSNVRSVAERRMIDLKIFLESLFSLSNEVAHCDLVYTMFHTILRDSSPESQGGTKVPEDPLQSVGKISGTVSLKLTYSRGVLNVFVGHARKLALLPGSGAAPDAYVKCYLRPDVRRQSKRKTRIVRRTQNPTYNETLTYQLPIEIVERYTLEVTVWHCDSLKENSFLGGVNVPLSRLMGAGTDKRGTKVLDDWWSLARLPRSKVQLSWSPLFNAPIGGE